MRRSPDTAALPWLTFAALAAAGAGVGTLSMLVSAHPEADAPALWRNIALSAVCCVVSLAIARRHPPARLNHVFLVGGTYLVSNAAYQSGDGGTYYAVWYMWIALYAFAFHSRRAAAMHLALVAATYAAVLAERPVDDAVARWLTTVMTLVIAATFVDRLVGGLRRHAAEAEKLMAQLELAAQTDELTGLPNRRSWEAALTRELARAARSGDALSVAVLDLDGFKQLNDRHGHQAGDLVLRAVASAWSALVRDVDTLARWGGDEFGLLLPGSVPEDALQVLERLRRGTPSETTCSAGVVTWDRSEDAVSLLRRADEALYGAKRTGRDRVATA